TGLPITPVEPLARAGERISPELNEAEVFTRRYGLERRNETLQPQSAGRSGGAAVAASPPSVSFAVPITPPALTPQSPPQSFAVDESVRRQPAQIAPADKLAYPEFDISRHGLAGPSVKKETVITQSGSTPSSGKPPIAGQQSEKTPTKVNEGKAVALADDTKKTLSYGDAFVPQAQSVSGGAGGAGMPNQAQ